jgi:hypothetical protein
MFTDAHIELGSGMLAVVPAWKLTELLGREDVRGMREDTNGFEELVLEEIANPDVPEGIDARPTL